AMSCRPGRSWGPPSQAGRRERRWSRTHASSTTPSLQRVMQRSAKCVGTIRRPKTNGQDKLCQWKGESVTAGLAGSKKPGLLYGCHHDLDERGLAGQLADAHSGAHRRIRREGGAIAVVHLVEL